jgi:2,3-bisphosphoglycerate-dependent phosphoglycerate mutase
MPQTHIFLVRHGETEWNLTRRYQGQLDSPLTRHGLRQAAAAGQRLLRESISALYASDLGRAWRTATIIGDACGLEPQPDSRLRERHFGVFHGLTRTEMSDLFPQLYEHHQTHDPRFAPPGGESLQALRHRAVTCLHELADRHVGGMVALVGHGGTLAALIKYVLGLPAAGTRPFKVANAGINLLSRDDDHWCLEVLGDTSHLSDGGLDDVD